MTGDPRQLTRLLPDGPESLVSASDAAAILRVAPQTIRLWARKGLLRIAGLDERKHMLFRARDLAEAERRSRGAGGGNAPRTAA